MVLTDSRGVVGLEDGDVVGALLLEDDNLGRVHSGKVHVLRVGEERSRD